MRHIYTNKNGSPRFWDIRHPVLPGPLGPRTQSPEAKRAQRLWGRELACSSVIIFARAPLSKRLEQARRERELAFV